jgi:hypothetical protein
VQNSTTVTIPREQWSVIHTAIITSCMNLAGMVDWQEVEQNINSIVEHLIATAQ